MAEATISSFVKSLPRFSDALMARFLNSWDKNTQFTFAEAQRKVPVAAGELLRSGRTLKAKITSNGVISSIVYAQPYAEKLNDPQANIRLKEAGEFSYYAKGQRVTKRQKGELGWLDKTVDREAKRFLEDVKKSIDIEWNKLPG